MSDRYHDACMHVANVVIQRESARADEAHGVIAFLSGALDEVSRCTTVEDAKTCAAMAMQSISEWQAGTWKPGPHDDPANWRKR